MPLVVALARRYRGYGVPQDELVSEGHVGVVRALQHFDSKKARFSTYAGYWIRAHMLAYVLRQSSIVTVATGAVGAKLFFKLRAARARLETKLGPGHERIDRILAAQFDVTEEQIRAHSGRMTRSDASLDAPLGEDGEETRLDGLASDTVLPDEAHANTQRKVEIEAAVDSVWDELDDRERAVVTRRFLAEDEAPTLQELGSSFNLSRERLRQIESNARRKLKAALTAQGADHWVH